MAVLDSGVSRHPDLDGKVMGFHDFVGNRRFQYDDNGHGTHICGIICGSGTASRGVYEGIAPGSMLAVGKVLDKNGDGTVEAMLEGLAWVLSSKEKYDIRILNVSVGIGMLDSAEKESAMRQEIEKLWNAGITVVCAAGNKGPGASSISAVGGSNKVLTVGCHDGEFHKHDPAGCERYSGRGGVFAAVRKPDLVAPGTNIVSCNAACRKERGKYREAYIAKSGTSMATPIVSGAAALALQKFPHMSNEELKQKITITATDLHEPWNKQGWGMVNVRRLLE